MNGEERNLTLQNAVLEWQKKYGIRDGDPMLASLELFHIYLRGDFEQWKHAVITAYLMANSKRYSLIRFFPVIGKRKWAKIR